MQTSTTQFHSQTTDHTSYGSTQALGAVSGMLTVRPLCRVCPAPIVRALSIWRKALCCQSTKGAQITEHR